MISLYDCEQDIKKKNKENTYLSKWCKASSGTFLIWFCMVFTFIRIPTNCRFNAFVEICEVVLNENLANASIKVTLLATSHTVSF
uniref:Uncharacterized protein n=1 Tax=Glossina palpalis gambiensis TaxID=67801 RepID=A0A1B0AUG2_9MUSC